MPARTGEFDARWLGRRLAALLPDLGAREFCVAFSGGADSTALLAALARLRRPGFALRAVHVNHQLQPAATRWSAHCRGVARALGVPLQVRRIVVARRRGESLAAAARTARYRALAAALRPGELLLTAHQQDDQLETVLLQLLRGAGVAGLAAMPAVAAFGATLQVRPLLNFPGAALRAWLRAQRLDWVEDASNLDERFDRNYLRQRVLPALRARWPAAAATAARRARPGAEAQGLLDALAAADVAAAALGTALSAAALRRLPPARRRNALRHWIAGHGVPPPPAARLTEMAGALLDARADAQPEVCFAGVRVRREAQLLTLGPRAPAPPAVRGLRWRWRRGPLHWPGGGQLSLAADARGALDLAALAPVLTVRSRGGGERLRPRSGGPRRPLKGLLQEARVPVEERARLPLIFSGRTLVAVADRWLDAGVQAGPRTRQRGRLRFEG